MLKFEEKKSVAKRLTDFLLIIYNYSHLYSRTFLDTCTDYFIYRIRPQLFNSLFFFYEVFLRFDHVPQVSLILVAKIPTPLLLICVPAEKKTLGSCFPVMLFSSESQPSTALLVLCRNLFIFHISMVSFWFSINFWV